MIARGVKEMSRRKSRFLTCRPREITVNTYTAFVLFQALFIQFSLKFYSHFAQVETETQRS